MLNILSNLTCKSNIVFLLRQMVSSWGRSIRQALQIRQVPILHWGEQAIAVK
jgi:hypothetical protein